MLPASSSRSYYLFFNYLSYYLYVLPVWYMNRRGVLPVWYKTTPFRVTRLVLKNSQEGTVKLTDLVPNQRLGKSLSC